jgi:hypothetical protein
MATIFNNLENTAEKADKLRRTLWGGGLILAALFLLGSCEKGLDGWPGRAYVAFSWIVDEPDYIEIDNEYVPPVFYWDEFYRVAPGLYFAYYEGYHRVGRQLYEYAWELEYEVWENPGEPGRVHRQNGVDGPDAYFTIVLSPYGPETLYEEVARLKSAVDELPENLPAIGDEIVIEQSDEDFNLIIRYKKVEPRNLNK